ncbi:hypothetical protein AAG068_18835 [Bacillus paramycoides]|uniref:hypothetical protein n=1 Tax=Bacillus paramycoides TaxID=2026194 RepID=UPI0031842397
MADAPKLLPKDTLKTGYPKINQAIDNANEAIKPATRGRIADNAVNFEKLNVPEAQVINRNYIEVNYKTRKITILRNCYIALEKYAFNISPTQVEIPLPDPVDDGALHLLVYNHRTSELSCKRFTLVGDNEVSIVRLYAKKVYGSNFEFITFISDDDNYNYLTDRKIIVTNTNIASDTLDYTRINMYETTIIEKDKIIVDLKSKKLVIKPNTFSTMGNDIFNLNQTGTSLYIDLPSDARLYALVVDITKSPYTVSFEVYNDKAKFKNKRLLFYYYNNVPLGKNTSFIKVIGEMGEILTIKEIIHKHLNNPFVRTIIKLIGDSITAGLCGTGYSATDKPIGNTGYKTNVTTAVCWANMLRDHILAEYNREFDVSVNDPNIAFLAATHQIVENNAATFK